ncbi:MAG: DUF6145 family protein [Lachnospiraceae bacterium]|nr:DUF6145 family protein [Lachnospiraceae bacterium]
MQETNQDEIILCGSSAYTKKFYLNEEFAGLPEGIKEDLKILCVLYTEDIGGTFQMVYDKEGHLLLRTDCNEGDFCYDEIGSVLKIKQIQREKAELLESLEMYYKVFFLGEVFSEEE